MTRRRKTLLTVLALVLVAAGGFAWYWQATAVDRQVRALLAAARGEEPGLIARWLIKLGLLEDRAALPGWDAARDLVKLGPPAVPELIRALRDSDGRVRWTVARALGKLGDPRAVEPLIAALTDEEHFVREPAAWALGRLGDPRAVGPLIVALKDDYALVRRSATVALRNVGDARAIEPLEELLDDIDADVRKAAMEALKQIRQRSEAKP